MMVLPPTRPAPAVARHRAGAASTNDLPGATVLDGLVWVADGIDGVVHQPVRGRGRRDHHRHHGALRSLARRHSRGFADAPQRRRQPRLLSGVPLAHGRRPLAFALAGRTRV